MFSRLRRGDFWYITILFKAFSYQIFVRASGEASLGTQRYFSMHVLMRILSHRRRGDLGTQRYLVDASTILGTQRYFIKALYQESTSLWRGLFLNENLAFLKISFFLFDPDLV